MSPFETYIAPAGKRTGWWRPVAGMIVILASWVAGAVLIVGFWAGWHAISAGDPDAALSSVDRLLAGGQTGGILVILLTFSGIWFGAAVAMQGFHDQRFGAIFGPRGSGGFWRGLLVGAGFSGVSILVAILFAGAPVQAQSITEWAPMAVPILVLLFVQATGEEIIFRGYLLQQIAVRTRNPVFWAVLPSLAFGLMHYSAELPNGGGLYYVAITALLGVTLAVVVWRTGSLWTAAGIHVGINAGSLLFVGAEGILSGPQLWLFPGDDLGRIFVVDLALCVALLVLMLSPAGRWFAPVSRA